MGQAAAASHRGVRDVHRPDLVWPRHRPVAEEILTVPPSFLQI